MRAVVNIGFPWGLAASGGTAIVDTDRHIRDMIEQLLFTVQGERVNRPDFGNGLQQLIFAPNSLELAATLQVSVQVALQRDLGDVIEVGEVLVAADDAAVRLSVDYRVRRSSVPGQARLTLASFMGLG